MVIFFKIARNGNETVALDRWGGKWNLLSTTVSRTIEYAENYCKWDTNCSSYYRTCTGSHILFSETQCI